MSFEAFNAVVKRAANRSNYKNECVTVLCFWSMKSALALKRRCSAAWLDGYTEETVCLLDEES